MSRPIVPTTPYYDRFTRWLLKAGKSEAGHHHAHHPWWKVMCLTGVDYFSTLGYQPGIAALAAGSLSPLATFILVLLTLFGALPIYRRVARTSPHGEGSIAMLEHLLPRWRGKLFVLCLLGFVATDFIITITLSAADATAHIIENPFVSNLLDRQQIPLTLILISLLGAVFLKGFQEAIDLSVFLVFVYLLLNLIVVGEGIFLIFQDPSTIAHWKDNLFAEHSHPLTMLGISLLLFPKLALGLSGFETGVAVMPLIEGDETDTPNNPRGRIQNTHKLLTVVALIMSFFLIASSFVTILLIPTAEFQVGGKANGRALAYLAHRCFGDGFGTLYDLSTIAILWFAGASAMAGLLNIVPHYLPRYGMAPQWASAIRPLVLVYTGVAFVVTLLFNASVDAQGGAYATGVLVLMTSAALAVTLLIRQQNNPPLFFLFALIALVFLYTTIVNIIERPEGIQIASFFIGSIIVISMLSRVSRSTELRVDRVEINETAQRFISETRQSTLRLLANRLDKGDSEEYYRKEKEMRKDNHIPPTDAVLFLEIQVSDASEFAGTVAIQGVEVGTYQILRAQGAAVPNTIAAILLSLRDRTGKEPHVYFGWAEGNPLQFLMRFILLGEGDVAIMTREVLRKAEPDPDRRPAIHIGG
jgi:hypothetical protein